jgi:hypothetical protein
MPSFLPPAFVNHCWNVWARGSFDFTSWGISACGGVFFPFLFLKLIVAPVCEGIGRVIDLATVLWLVASC